MSTTSADEKQSLVGTWRLVSWVREAEDGTLAATPLGDSGASLIGYLVYTDDGHVFAQFMRNGPREFSGTVDIARDGIEFIRQVGFLAYGGTYEIREGEVVHHIELHLNPQTTGRDWVREVEWDGDHLVLKHGDQAGGLPGETIITWERVTPR